jgi:formate/nitrite transporter FocA (FNT family)
MGRMTQLEDERQSIHEEAEERSAPSGKVVYKAILGEGEDELKRPSSALFWSGLAAGLSMGFSLIAEGLLRAHLPDAHWRPMIAKFGYSIGFLIVILGRQQLFTENTLTPILPLLQRKDGKTLANVGRLWSIVLLANLIGGAAVACAVIKTPAFESSVRATFIELGQAAMSHPFGTVLIKGVFAGWLIALMVWLLPFAEAARVHVIIIITYLVGLGELSHIIAGSIEVFVLAWAGVRPWTEVLGGYVLPALIGNVLGGVTLVAALNHAQVVAGDGEDV